MPRFHFDVTDDDGHFDDDEGVEFIDIATMRQHAMRAAGAMVGEQTSFPREPWCMVVRDEARGIVATLTFAVS